MMHHGRNYLVRQIDCTIEAPVGHEISHKIYYKAQVTMVTSGLGGLLRTSVFSLVFLEPVYPE